MIDLHNEAEEMAKLPYTLMIRRDITTDGDYMYLAINPELKGCMTQGEKMQEAEENLDAFRIDYILHLLEQGIQVPLPPTTSMDTEGGALYRINCTP